MNQDIERLLDRASSKLLVAPGPNEAELDLIFQAAMRAPDHGSVRPWRFKLINDPESIAKFAQYSIELRQKSDHPMPEQKAKATLAWLSNLPLIIAIGSKLGSERIPEEETILATGCAVMNMLNAIHMLGYGAFWSTGAATYIDEFQQGMGFDALEYRYLGILAVGTHMSGVPEKERPDWRQFVETWTQPL
ncbi:nitroreductase family protein [Basilea psittacipulmonis]|uniref:Putative NAD(P)H nitroreductase n=1 Tax=Basilea psittacipulmonis DSM 24701 TaxID=1072685 RepID=A0A077DFA6_9BURK|nr:nitroreductase [Basilea psittacipulmonis]AIL32806.1 nitroreductase [Basilea psittacipulmonis DSM 24701]